MGAVQAACFEDSSRSDEIVVPVLVTLHIYDVAPSSHMVLLNRILSLWGTGAFHAGVEIYDREWSFGSCGITSCTPRKCDGHSYYESVSMGYTIMSELEVQRLIVRLKQTWTGDEYDVLSKNCCHFSDELCHRLAGARVPDRIKSLAAAGKAFMDTADDVANKAFGRRRSAAERLLTQAVTGICGVSGSRSVGDQQRGRTGSWNCAPGSCAQGARKLLRNTNARAMFGSRKAGGSEGSSFFSY